MCTLRGPRSHASLDDDGLTAARPHRHGRDHEGTDFAFSGAVDALQINDIVYDFEPNGVFETAGP